MSCRSSHRSFCKELRCCCFLLNFTSIVSILFCDFLASLAKKRAVCAVASSVASAMLTSSSISMAFPVFLCLASLLFSNMRAQGMTLPDRTLQEPSRNNSWLAGKAPAAAQLCSQRTH